MANKKAISKSNLELALTENNKKIKQYTDTKVSDKVPSTRTVNGKALSSNITLSASDVGAEPSGTAASKVAEHNTATDAHNDMRLLIEDLVNRLNALANSDDTTLDQMSEIVAYIKNNKSLIENITTNKVNVADIINNLTTNNSGKPLSAAQGVALKKLIDTMQATVDTLNAAKHTHSNSSVLNNTTASYTTEEQTKLKNIAEGANNYTHPKSGATAGTYRSVTVDANGHVTGGSNPTLGLAAGGTGATTAAAARTNLGLGSAATYNVDINRTANGVLWPSEIVRTQIELTAAIPESGTFTLSCPAKKINSTNVVTETDITYTFSGKYYKVGNLVWIIAEGETNSDANQGVQLTPTTGAPFISVTGFPFQITHWQSIHATTYSVSGPTAQQIYSNSRTNLWYGGGSETSITLAGTIGMTQKALIYGLYITT